MIRLLFILILCLRASGAIFTLENAAENFLSMASNEGLNTTNEVTICLWTDRYSGSAVGGQIISKGNHLAGPRDQYSFGNSTTNGFDFYYYEYNTSLLSQWRSTNDAYIDTREVDFIALTYNYADSSSIKIYVNGDLKGGSWIANTPTGRGPTNINSNQLDIGQGNVNSNPCGGGTRWQGYYSELALWSVVLTPTQLEMIRKSKMKGIQRQVRPDALRMYLQLDSVPDKVLLIPVTGAGASRFPDRQIFGPFAYRCDTGTDPHGAAERVCSYPPNE